MKFSQETMNVLKNFSQINQGIVFRKGDVVATISPQKNILAEATIKESFPMDFGIYDLPNLISVLSLSNESPEIAFQDKQLVISGNNGRSTITFRYTDAGMIVVPPDKKLTVPAAIVSFDLTEVDLEWVLRCAAVLQQPNVSIESDGKKVYVTTFDSTNDASHTQKLTIADGNGETYKFVLRTENIKLLSADYKVEATKGIITFSAKNSTLKYWIATEKTKE